MKFEDLTITLYADGADLDGMIEEYKKGYVKGFTTNPTLMKKAGVKDYVTFAKAAIEAIPDLPISFEVFAEDFDGMEKEAKVLSELSDNVYVKIPIMNAKGESSIPLIKRLSEQGIKLNVTAIFTLEQVEATVAAFKEGTKNIVSVFAGRIMDAGVDAVPIMVKVKEICKSKPGTLSLWASCREVFNIVQADQAGTDIVTVTNDLLKKLPNLGKDLTQFSLETVQMFDRDSKALGFSIIK